jgi:membrane protein
MDTTENATANRHANRIQTARTGARPDENNEKIGTPTDLSKPSLFAVLKRTRKEFKNDRVTDLAAALTYYAILAVVPGLIVVISALGLAGSNTTNQVLGQIQAITPGSSAKVIHDLISQAQSHKSGAGLAAIVGIVIVLWSASGYVAAFMRASNVVYGIGEGRPIWKTAPIRLGVTLVAVILLVVSAVIVVVSGSVAKQVGDAIGAGSSAVLAWEVAKWPVLLITVSVLLAILFWASPNAKQAGIKWVSPGGLIATFLWLVFSALFALYVTNFSSYDKTYGPLAGIVVFLVWLWLTNIALLFGAEINAELEHGRAIADGLPEDVQPFAEPRDTRKLDDESKTAVDNAQAARRR